MGLFTKKNFERILKEAGAERVSDSASEALANYVEEKIFEIAEKAVELAKHVGRKTILKNDIILAKKRVLE
ncbi:MAG: histone [Candidatus Aenigmarchaeota archaeon ex4484_224]|nr:MAG: histone [Candidatus Aenigmarchaeota archaeon ex4484_224]